MICILGDSCAGKTTIERELVKHGYNRIISYTTRPIRACETNHIDYHFITEEEFARMSLAESTVYNSWHYGISKEDAKNDAIAVVEPVGFRELKSKEWLDIVSFYIKVPERERVIRMMKRGDNVMESFRRIISDQGSFNGIEREVDFVINNDKPVQTAVKEIVSILDKYYEEPKPIDACDRYLLTE